MKLPSKPHSSECPSWLVEEVSNVGDECARTWSMLSKVVKFQEDKTIGCQKDMMNSTM